MRNYMKNSLLELVDTMRELCNEILQEYGRGNIDYVLEMLADGQQAAISIGETIEKLEGEGTEAVLALESFCDHIYHLNEMVGTGELVISKECKVLDKLLLNVINGINHLPVTYEIVFFPYKASMWDCLESIYLAAALDPDCHTYVVPIPYYDVGKGGRLGRMCYEGNQFPKAIPITPWEEYKLSDRKPDIAYIHNPFDGYNLVTRIHPEYYSDRLKRYVNKLVYVPYGISRGAVAESHQHLPAHENIDYLVIQSRILEKAYKDESLKGKMLPLGSPKFDRVINYQKRGVEIPEEWRDILEGKIKFFYNTSLSSLLADTEAALKKIEYVFNCIEGRGDVALIWRPHPLMETTLQSMRPQYLEWYQKLVQHFIKSGIGVFDQTDDMDETIAMSDAYIGEDTSSSVDVFCVTGKPLFIFDMKINKVLSEVEYCDPLFCNVTECNGKNWTFSYLFNALCTLDMDTGRLHIVDSIPGYKKNQRYLVSNVYSYHGKLILSPSCMDSIVEYDVETGKFRFIKLPNALPSGNMGGIIPCGDDFLIVPVKYSAFIQYSSQKKKYIYHWQVIEKVRKLSSGKEFVDNRSYFCGSLIKEGLLYFTLAQTNAILIWHIDTCKYEIVHVGDEENTYGAIVDVKGGFLLRMYEGARLLFWNPQTGETREIDQFPKEFKYRPNPMEREHPFGGFLTARNHLLLMLCLGNQMLEINKETLEISIYEMDWKEHIREPQEGVFDNRWNNIRSVVWTDWNSYVNQECNEIAIVTSADGCMLKLNIETHQYTEVQTGYEQKDLKKWFPIEELYDKFVIPIKGREDRYHALSDFIDAMVDGRISRYNSQQIKVYGELAVNLDGTCGEKVHRTIKKTL